jgi:hypothetical protein
MIKVKKIKIADKEFNFPKTYNDLTLGQYIEVAKLDRDRANYMVKGNETFGEYLFALKMIEVLCNIKPNDLDDVEIKEFSKFTEAIHELLSNTKLKSITTFKYLDHDYYFKSFDNLTNNEYISYETKRVESESNLDILPELLAIICRPGKITLNKLNKKVTELDRFDATELVDRAEAFKTLPAYYFIDAANFFLNRKNTTVKNSNNYTSQKKEKINTQ